MNNHTTYTRHEGGILYTQRTGFPQPQYYLKEKAYEDERTGQLAENLRSLGKNLSVKTFIKKYHSKLCPFTGGGDIYLSRGTKPGEVYDVDQDPELGGAVIQSDLDLALDRTLSDSQSSPLLPLEVRPESSIELKTVKPQDDIDSQLRANLMLAVSHSFMALMINTVRTTSSCSSVENVKTLSGYGLTFGCNTDCVVYKLVMNLDNNECTYHERVRQPFSALHRQKCSQVQPSRSNHSRE